MKRKYSYKDIKLCFFDNALTYCKFKFKNRAKEPWKYDGSEYGFAADNMPNLQHPLESLMLIIIMIIENAGRDTFFDKAWLESIKKIIAKHTLDDLIADLLPEEREDEFGFLYDLNLILENQKLEEK